jgi:hypothetical protein
MSPAPAEAGKNIKHVAESDILQEEMVFSADTKSPNPAFSRNLDIPAYSV